LEDSSFAWNEDHQEDELENAACMSHWLFHRGEKKVNKFLNRRANRLIYAVNKEMDNLLVNVNYQVLEQVGWTDNSSIQALRKYFDDSKDAAKKLLLDEANKMLKDIDDCYEKLLTNVVLSVLKPLELKMKEHK
jgi:hypothetical protein